jgi:hypothetical protein
MRALVIPGLVLIALGFWLIFWPPSYSHHEKVLKVGDLEASVQEQRPIPGWVGGIALGAGLVLVVVGVKRT